MGLQEEWVISIRQKLKEVSLANHGKPRTKHSIYKVPHWMKDEQRTNVPEIISIGPYHHDEPHLRPMEAHKWRVLNHLLTRKSQDINLYFTEIMKLENEARDCYESSVGLDSNQFVKMLVLDGCFVLEFLNRHVTAVDPVFRKDSVRHLITMDLIKLENQIPMIVLRKLFEIQSNNAVENEEVRMLVMSVLTPELVTSNVKEDELEQVTYDVAQEQNNKPMVHCLDVFRRSLMYNPNVRDHVTEINTDGELPWSIDFISYCTSELRDVGINFKPRRQLPFWKIDFNERNGILWIHPFIIDNGTEKLFRNLIAYEQCHMTRPTDMVITDYVAFMDNLIETAADVAYLRKAGIIVNYLGSDAEVADLLNRLGNNVFTNKKTLQGEYQKLHEYCGRRSNRWRASLKNEYLRNPWVIISIIAAFFLFIFTGVQTGYAVYAYYDPPRTTNPPRGLHYLFGALNR